MGKFEVISFPDDVALAQTAAKDWLERLDWRNGPGKDFCVALSGGRIAKTFFTAVATQALARKSLFDCVQFFWADERCVPPGDLESNFRIARELLLAPLNISERQIHRIRGEEPAEFAVAEAEAELCRVARLNVDGHPILDLIFLGMGEDGHVASLFAGEPEAVRSSLAVYRAVTASKPPPRRITLGYNAIASAGEVWVLASGSGKEAALRASLRSDGQTPLARVLGLRGRTKILTDIPC